jgi:hypothetical protein
MKPISLSLFVIAFACAPISSDEENLLPPDAAESSDAPVDARIVDARIVDARIVDARPPDAPTIACQVDADCVARNSECTVGVCDTQRGICVAMPSAEGDPCEARLTCDEYTLCAFADACALTGERTRSCTAFACRAGTCAAQAPVMEADTTACTRSTDTHECGSRFECEEFAGCVYSSICTNDGTRTRTCYPLRCGAGICGRGEAYLEPDTVGCARNTASTKCDEPACEAYSECTYDLGTCDNSGSRTRTCTPRVCSGGGCAAGTSYVEIDTAGCQRDTAGSTCAPVSCGGFGQCVYADMCVNHGSQTRTCTPQVCLGEKCASGTSFDEVDTTGCGRNTNGVECGPLSCTDWGACNYGDTCASVGSQTRTCSTPICGSGQCGSSSGYTDSFTCTRNTDGMTCGAGERCCWVDPVTGKPRCSTLYGSCSENLCEQPICTV